MLPPLDGPPAECTDHSIRFGEHRFNGAELRIADEDYSREMVGGRPGPHDGGVALAVCDDLHRNRFSLIRPRCPTPDVRSVHRNMFNGFLD